MRRFVVVPLAALGLLACNGVIAADSGPGLDDWNLGYVDAGSYYGSSSSGGGRGSSSSEDASPPPPPTFDDASFSVDGGDALAPPPPPPPPGGNLVCPPFDSGYSWILTPSASDCHFEVPSGSPDPLRIDPTAMHLELWSEGLPGSVAEYRPTLADCDDGGGWSWGLDEGTAGPSRIVVCPGTCESFSDPTLTIRFTTTTQCERR